MRDYFNIPCIWLSQRKNIMMCTHPTPVLLPQSNVATGRADGDIHRSHCPLNHGYRGVCYEKEKDLWRARLYVKGRYITLGRFSTARLAAKAHDRAAHFVMGEWAATNFRTDVAKEKTQSHKFTRNVTARLASLQIAVLESQKYQAHANERHSRAIRDVAVALAHSTLSGNGPGYSAQCCQSNQLRGREASGNETECIPGPARYRGKTQRVLHDILHVLVLSSAHSRPNIPTGHVRGQEYQSSSLNPQERTKY